MTDEPVFYHTAMVDDSTAIWTQAGDFFYAAYDEQLIGDRRGELRVYEEDDAWKLDVRIPRRDRLDDIYSDVVEERYGTEPMIDLQKTFAGSKLKHGQTIEFGDGGELFYNEEHETDAPPSKRAEYAAMLAEGTSFSIGTIGGGTTVGTVLGSTLGTVALGPLGTVSGAVLGGAAGGSAGTLATIGGVRRDRKSFREGRPNTKIGDQLEDSDDSGWRGSIYNHLTAKTALLEDLNDAKRLEARIEDQGLGIREAVSWGRSEAGIDRDMEDTLFERHFYDFDGLRGIHLTYEETTFGDIEERITEITDNNAFTPDELYTDEQRFTAFLDELTYHQDDGTAVLPAGEELIEGYIDADVKDDGIMTYLDETYPATVEQVIDRKLPEL